MVGEVSVAVKHDEHERMTHADTTLGRDTTPGREVIQSLRGQGTGFTELSKYTDKEKGRPFETFQEFS